ncbi:hypothetical protein PX701_08765 [Agromyces sp. H3Y2-19a]|uniref:hypothetical protein n=1 Tax=Agromyces chromiiresistens TaxID=3030835 RepID=UPI0023BA2C8E|nr:hypothetical protein [Agromyces chromiiresistens]MDF0513712.1 hypothetical protein [Agromyces chromiiresistens]
MTAVEPGAAVDPVLRRLPAAAWRSLPALAVLGVAVVAVYAAAGRVLGPASPITWIVVAALAAPGLLWAVDRLGAELFELGGERPGFGRRLLVVAVFAVAPCMLAAWSALVAVVAEASGSVAFQVLAVAGTALAVVAALVAAVAIPVGVVRADVRLRSIVAMAFIAVVRRPLGPVSAVVAAAAVVWLGLTWLTVLLAIAAPVFVVLAVGCAWPTAAAVGVALPPLVPLRRSPITVTQGEA